MKYIYIHFHLLIASLAILMSMSECELDYEIPAPVAAEINGKEFSSDAYTRYSGYQSTCSPHQFIFDRELYSSDGENYIIRFDKTFTPPDELQIGIAYTCECSICEYMTDEGTFKITKTDECMFKITELSNDNKQAHGEFEFTIEDKETGSIVYSVLNGKFSIPWNNYHNHQ